MDLATLISSILLAVAASWSLILLNRLRDWRVGFVIACLAATTFLLVLTVGGQVVTAGSRLPLGTGGIQQLAISGLAVAAVLYLHLIYERDALTGLPNRSRFVHAVRRQLARLEGDGGPSFAVLALSLDRFKLVNQSLGQAEGDRLLLKLAKLLAAAIRPVDVLARVGGDEFAVLLKEQDLAGAEKAAERLQRQLSEPIILGGQEVSVTARVGIVVGSPYYDDAEDLLRGAQLAMNRVITGEHAAHQVYDASKRRYAVERLKLESSLRRAVEREEFVVHYQPIFLLHGGGLAGFEALVRWRHGEQGVLSPARFIPIAEESDLIVSIGKWVLEEACVQLKAWQEQVPGLSQAIMHVNLSGRQFKQPDLVDQVGRLLGTSGLSPSCLTFEITESVMMDDAALTTTILRDLRSLDVGLAVDDFGTGYSSLRYLSTFPVDALKIDGSFVRGAAGDPANEKIIRSIVNLARDLDLGVIAEGIETRGQLEFLQSLHCGCGQGHYLGEPMSAEAASRLLASGHLVSRKIVRSSPATGIATPPPLSLMRPTRKRPSRDRTA